MRVSNILARLSRHTGRFVRAENGNIAVLFAIALLPVLGFVGAAIDYSRASSARSSMQAALDSTALMVSRDFSTGKIKASDIASAAQNYFNALYTNTDGQSVTVQTTYTPNTGNGSTVKVTGSGKVTTEFMKVVGVPTMDIGSASTTTWGSVRLRVALVLDTTGSMASAGKMDALKSATQSLLTKLRDASSVPEDVYVSIVPFSKNVNLGPSNYGASWIDWTDWESEPTVLSSKPTGWDQIGPGSSCPFNNSTHGFVCASGPTSTSTTNTIASSGANAGLICPATDSGRKDSTKIGLMYNGCYSSVQKTRQISSGSSASCGSNVNCSCSGSGRNRKCDQTYFDHPWVVNAKSTWNGCVTDRGNASGPVSNYDRLVSAPSGSIAASKYPAEQNSYCSPQGVGLNNSWSSMNTLVNNLYPLGATNQPIGLVWGWQTLVGGGPFTAPAKDPQFTYADVIVLMSDGLNTLNRWNGNGSDTNSDVDKRMHESETVGTCANIKATKVKIYAVHVNTDGDPQSTLLRNCASQSEDGGKEFQMVTSASGIDTAFSSIATKLTKLRIAF